MAEKTKKVHLVNRNLDIILGKIEESEWKEVCMVEIIGGKTVLARQGEWGLAAKYAAFESKAEAEEFVTAQ